MSVSRSVAARGALAAVLMAGLGLAQNFVPTAGGSHSVGRAPAVPETTLTTELVVSGLANPTLALSPPGDPDRIFVLEQITGLIRVVRNKALLVAPFLDLSSLVSAGGEMGLLGLAFHPQFASNGRFFVVYNDLAGDWTLASYTVTPPSGDSAQFSSGQVLLTIPKPFPQHNGGMVAFGRDRYLYASTGDGGAGNDPFGNAQSTSSLLGKILRLDVDGGTPYAIPPTNPFAGVPGAAPEIWALGLRNPWRFSIDSLTGDLWVGDVGQETNEEVDFLPFGVGGLNFGWNCLEGSLCTGLGSCTCPDPTFTAPIHEFSHAVGCAVMGGVVYRGQALPALAGTYFFADYCTGQVWSLRYEKGAVTEFTDRTSELDPPSGSLGLTTAIGTDGAGEILFATYGGKIYRVVANDPAPDCDGDGVTDVVELFQGTAFDVDQDGKPDECQLLLTVPDGLVLGSPVNLTFLGAQPGQEVTFFYSWRGIGPGPTVFDGNLQLDLSAVNLDGTAGVPMAGTAVADASGQAVLSWVVQTGVVSGQMSFQAAIDLGPASVKSNPVQKIVGR